KPNAMIMNNSSSMKELKKAFLPAIHLQSAISTRLAIRPDMEPPLCVHPFFLALFLNHLATAQAQALTSARGKPWHIGCTREGPQVWQSHMPGSEQQAVAKRFRSRCRLNPISNGLRPLVIN